MSEMPSIESVMQRFLENRDGLTDGEFQFLLETLRSQPQLAEQLKDQLLMDEQLAQQFHINRQDFLSQFEKRLQAETADSPPTLFSQEEDASAETYALRTADPVNAETNGSDRAGRISDSSETQSTRADDASDQAGRPREPDSSSQGRTLFAVFAGLLLAAAGLLRLEYSDAARKIAVVNEVSGMALIYRKDVGIVAAAGMPILPSDEIRVQDAAQLRLTYRDQSQLRIGPKSRIVLQPNASLLPGILAGEKSKEISLLEGRLEADVKRQPADWPLVLETPHVTANVRGTRLILTVNGDQSQVEVLEGEVSVQSPHHAQSPVKLTAGLQVLATRREFQVNPGPWPSDREGIVFLLPPTATETFSTNQGLRIHAEGRDQTEVIIRPRRNAKWEAGRLRFRGGAILANPRAASDLLAACKQSNELSLEMTFQTSELSQTGPARLMTFSTSSQNWNFSLVQEDRKILLRLLTATKPGDAFLGLLGVGVFRFLGLLRFREEIVEIQIPVELVFE